MMMTITQNQINDNTDKEAELVNDKVNSDHLKMPTFPESDQDAWIQQIADCGYSSAESEHWNEVVNSIKFKLSFYHQTLNNNDIATNDNLVTINHLLDRINVLLSHHQSIPPFTCQRVCELVNNPLSCYKNAIKYLNALEKVLDVTCSYE